MSKIESKLEWEEIVAEIDKVKDFFAMVKDEDKIEAANYFIYEMVRCVVPLLSDYLLGLGILEDAKLRFREHALMQLQEEEKD